MVRDALPNVGLDGTGAARDGSDPGLAWLSLMASGTGDVLWTLDVGTHTLRIFLFDELGIMQTRALSDPVATLAADGDVHPGSIDDLAAFVAGALEGRDRDETTVRLMNHATDRYSWHRLSYLMQRDERGRATRAVGVSREVGENDEPRSWYALIPECLRPHLLRVTRANLTTGRTESMSFRTDGQTSVASDTTLADAIDGVARLMLTPGEAEAYRTLADPATLTRRYEGGRRWSVGRYRMLDGENVRQVRVAVNVRRSLRGELMAYFYASVADLCSAWEAAAQTAVARDERTQLYQREYARVVARSIQAGASGGDLSAVSAIRLFELEPVPEGLLTDLMTAIGVFVDTDALAFRCDGQTVCAYIPSGGTSEDLRRRLQSAIGAARASLVDGSREDAGPLSRVRIVAQTVYATSDFLDVGLAIDQARATCEAVGASADDIVGTPVSQHGSDEVAAVPSAPDIEALDEAEVRAYAGIVSAMLNTGSSAQAVSAALRGIGLYHGARRVYVALVTHDDALLTIPFEWDDARSTSVKGRFTNSPISNFPFLQRGMGSDRPIYVSRTRTFPNPAAQASPVDPWRFCLVPMTRTGELTMLMCVDNPTLNLERWGLASCVATRVFHEWRLFTYARRKSRATTFGELGVLPGRRELTELLEGSVPASWNSIGALVVDIPDAVALVERQGFSHALDVYASIRAALEQYFDAQPTYHTDDTEFVALFPNSSYRAFVQRCAQARTALVNTHPREVHLGSAWSDTAHDARDVIEEARTISDHDSGAPLFETLEKAKPAARDTRMRPAEVASLARTSALAERFTVYLQPRFDMRTGKLAGAEALVRALRPGGRVAPPLDEVHQMERDGDISDLDYFVFDRVLSLMSSWSELGYDIPPISYNFSRSTLLRTTAAASVLAIMSRYPAVSPGDLEIEVDDAAVGLGPATLSKLVDTYRGLGLRVALDDFGASSADVSALDEARFDAVKLDRGLIASVADSDASRSLVRRVADACERRGMECVAEGVDSDAQAAALASEGCTLCQGFRYDKPLPTDLFVRKYLSA